jgi:hypothetical protein
VGFSVIEEKLRVKIADGDSEACGEVYEKNHLLAGNVKKRKRKEKERENCGDSGRI